jgi:serine/threonine-protein kinase RsbW
LAPVVEKSFRRSESQYPLMWPVDAPPSAPRSTRSVLGTFTVSTHVAPDLEVVCRACSLDDCALSLSQKRFARCSTEHPFAVNLVSDHFGRTAGLDEDALYRVGVAVRESVTNAIVHGNGSDKDKRVFIEFSPIEGDRHGIAISVRDQGAGFDLTMLSDPLTPENLMKPRGRGIFLIRTLMDEMTLHRGADGGMEMVMVKCVSSA